MLLGPRKGHQLSMLVTKDCTSGFSPSTASWRPVSPCGKHQGTSGCGGPGSTLCGDIPAENTEFGGTVSFPHHLLSFAAASAVEWGRHGWTHLSEELL